MSDSTHPQGGEQRISDDRLAKLIGVRVGPSNSMDETYVIQLAYDLRDARGDLQLAKSEAAIWKGHTEAAETKVSRLEAEVSRLRGALEDWRGYMNDIVQQSLPCKRLGAALENVRGIALQAISALAPQAPASPSGSGLLAEDQTLGGIPRLIQDVLFDFMGGKLNVGQAKKKIITAISYSESYHLPQTRIRAPISELQFALADAYGLPSAANQKQARVIEAIDAVKAEINSFLAAHSGKNSDAIGEVIAERERQISREGWTAEHDAMHPVGQLARAGAGYAKFAFANRHAPPVNWPWDEKWWKPKSPRRNLIRAAALIIAEIERMDRIEYDPPGVPEPTMDNRDGGAK